MLLPEAGKLNVVSEAKFENITLLFFYLLSTIVMHKMMFALKVVVLKVGISVK